MPLVSFRFERKGKTLDIQEAARSLRKALRGKRENLTVADAATRAGLSLRDAEKGLFYLLERYPSSLLTTDEGELVFRFENGLSRLRKSVSPVRRWLNKAGKALLGVGRFMLRAWISVVLVGYALVFLALVIALAFSKQSDDDERGFGFEIGYVLLRMVSEALFWTFHPFSPFAIHAYDTRRPQRRQRKKREQDIPFYEKVNRFLFGPAQPPVDPRGEEQRILAEIRARQGRIGISDLMRISGESKEIAETKMARLMLDYDGEVEVSDEGGITYRFPALRKTAATDEHHASSPSAPSWAKRLELGPLTGNSWSSNFLIAALNGVNLLGSLWAIGNQITIEKLTYLLQGIPWEMLTKDMGTPWALGWIPLFFSLASFAFPLGRALWRPIEKQKAAQENGRRAILRSVLDFLQRSKTEKSPRMEMQTLEQAFAKEAGQKASREEITQQVVALGGDVEIDPHSGRAYYRFVDLEAEVRALAAEREAASEQEAQIGDVIFRAEETWPQRA